MKKIRNINTDNYQQNFILSNVINKSPIRRNNGINTVYTQKSPIRFRTPQKNISPINNQHQIPITIRFISNVSPLKAKKIENGSELSNGNNLKYINQNDNKSKVSKNDRVSQYNKKSDRIMQEENRLFGKLVDKLNSEKKGFKSNESTHKTSVFAENSENKQNRIQQMGRLQGTFKQIINQAKTGEMKSQIKPSNGMQILQQPQNLSCMVYKIKNPRLQRQLLLQSNRTCKVNIPSASFLSKRNYPKPDEPKDIKQIRLMNMIQQDEYKDINFLLEKIEAGCRNTHQNYNQDEVKISLKVQQSLNMDPYLW